MQPEPWVEFPNDEFIRGERMAASPVPPLHKAKRRHITGDCSYILHDAILIHEVGAELQRVSGDDGFEIIYDRATTTDSIRPGHHIYRILRRGGVPSEDVMVLEFSCKMEMDKAWSPDNARPPGWWIVEEFKKRDRARMTAQQEAEADAEMDAANEKVKLEHATASMEKQREFAEAVDMKARKGRVSRRIDGVKSGV